MKKIFFEVLIITSVSISCAILFSFFKKIEIFPENTQVYLFSKKYPEIKFLNTDELFKLFKNEKVIIVDARERVFYEKGHIKGAINIPYNEFEIYPERFLNFLQKDKDIIIYCEGGYCEESFIVAEIILKYNFKNIFVYIDGYPVWEKRGLPREEIAF